MRPDFPLFNACNAAYWRPMKSWGQHRMSGILPVLITLLICVSTASAGSPVPYTQNQAGVRLGGWIGSGDGPADSFSDVDNFFDYDLSNVGSSGFFVEGFYNWRFLPPFGLEFSAGIISLGEVQRFDVLPGFDSGFVDFGNFLAYPFTVKIKYHPLSKTTSPWQPYVAGGLGVYYARFAIAITNRGALVDTPEESQVEFSYALAGGFDYVLSRSIALEANVNYYPMEFSTPIISVSDLNGLSVTVGVKWLFSTSENEDNDDRRRRRR